MDRLKRCQKGTYGSIPTVSFLKSFAQVQLLSKSIELNNFCFNTVPTYLPIYIYKLGTTIVILL